MSLVSTNLYGTLALLDLQAEAPLQEVLEWRTDLFTSKNGTEEATPLRQAPRQSFSMRVPVNDPAALARAFNLVYGQQGQAWAVPVWSEARVITGVASTVVSCDPTASDFRADSLCLIVNGSTFEVGEVSAVASDSLALAAPPAATGGYILPLRVGKIVGPVARDTDGHSGGLTINYRVDDNIDLAPAAPTQYLGYDIYFEDIYLQNDKLAEQHRASVEVVDNDLGAVATFDLWTHNRFARPHYVVLRTPAEAWSFRLWLHRRMGRYRPYWSPSFMRDLQHKSTGTVTTSLKVKPDGRLDGATGRTHIAVQDRDGNWYARAITDVVVTDADTLTLTLSSSLALAAANIARISYLGLRRLDTDRVEISWAGGVGVSAVSTVEVSP